MALVGLDVWKTRLGVTGTTTDGQLQQFLDEASAMVIDYCGTDFSSRNYPGAVEDGNGDSGLYCGDGSRRFVLRQVPVLYGSLSIWLDNSAEWGTNPDGSFVTATLLTEGRDYVAPWDGCLPGTTTKCSRSGIIERINGAWPGMTMFTAGKLVGQYIPARGNIKVAYTAGYTSVPMAVQSAVMQLATGLKRTAKVGAGIQSESLGGYSYSLAAGGASGAFPELGTIRASLAKFREIPV